MYVCRRYFRTRTCSTVTRRWLDRTLRVISNLCFILLSPKNENTTSLSIYACSRAFYGFILPLSYVVEQNTWEHHNKLFTFGLVWAFAEFCTNSKKRWASTCNSLKFRDIQTAYVPNTDVAPGIAFKAPLKCEFKQAYVKKKLLIDTKDMP